MKVIIEPNPYARAEKQEPFEAEVKADGKGGMTFRLILRPQEVDIHMPNNVTNTSRGSLQVVAELNLGEAMAVGAKVSSFITAKVPFIGFGKKD